MPKRPDPLTRLLDDLHASVSQAKRAHRGLQALATLPEAQAFARRMLHAIAKRIHATNAELLTRTQAADRDAGRAAAPAHGDSDHPEEA